MARHKLTARQVASNNHKPGRIGDGGNLFLLISKAGTKSWSVRVTVGGRVIECGLGSTMDVTLEEARQKAADYRKAAKAGLDPRTGVAPGAKAPISFGKCFELFYGTKSGELTSDKSISRWHFIRDTHFPAIANVAVASLDITHVLQVLQPVSLAAPTQVPFVASLIRRVVAYAAACGHRDPSLANPGDWELLSNVLPSRQKTTHHAAIPYGDVPGFVRTLRASGKVQARAVEFMILTATRRNEVREAQWSEIDFEKCTWTIPAERMKTRIEHVVPLTFRALAVLREQLTRRGFKTNEDNPFVFAGSRPNRPVSAAQMSATTTSDFTLHGFRSAFTDWATEETDHDRLVIEMSLSHVVGSSVERAYRRGNVLHKRGTLMKEWSQFIG